MESPTVMAREIAEIPTATQRFLDGSGHTIAAAAIALDEVNPHLLTTVARGSSDHAAAYLKYAFELGAGMPVASVGPSVSSIYDVQLALQKTVNLSISQSGQSPDIVQMARSAKSGGALTLALCNAEHSPLSDASDYRIDIMAGPEKSVAATKSFVNSVVAGLALLARWQNDVALDQAIRRLPDQFAAALACDWSPLIEHLHNHRSIFILGRGPAMAIAREAALKFKETCQIHAEAYSSAEFMHGPVSIIETGFPVLALASRDAAEPSVIEVSRLLMEHGGEVFITSEGPPQATRMPFVAAGHGLTDPLVLIVTFYAFIEKLARARGFDPDHPPHLRKVTETR